MSAIVLHHGKLLSLASTSKVIAADDVEYLKSMAEKADALSSLLSDEQQRVKQAHTQAQDAGYKAGFEAARQEGLDAAESELTTQRDELATRELQMQSNAMQMAFDIVRKLAASLDPVELLSALAITAANSCEPDEKLVLRVHESVQAAVSEKLLTSGNTHNRFTHVIGDASVPLSACIIETAASRVVADIETQTHLLEAQLVNR